MHVPDFVIAAITATVTRPVTVTNPNRVEIPLVHHDVASQLGEHCTTEFFGYDEVIDLNAVKNLSPPRSS